MSIDRRAYLAFPALAAIAAPFLVPSSDPAQAAPARAHQGSLCAADEVVIYQCGIGRKLVAVCGHDGHAWYRFGTPGHVELQSPSGALAYAREMYSGGGALQIRFSTAGNDYAVYSRTIRTGFGRNGRNNPQFSDGLFVRRNGRLISNRACTGPVSGSAQPEAYMPEGTSLDFPD